MLILKRLIALLTFAGVLASTISVRAQWIQAEKDREIVYFLFSAAPRLERYSLANQRWLSPISLPSTYGLPSAFAVDEAGLYVAYNTTLKRYNLEGASEFHLINTPEAIQNVFTDGDLLLVNRSVSL